jgi:hypothetical protein
MTPLPKVVSEMRFRLPAPRSLSRAGLSSTAATAGLFCVVVALSLVLGELFIRSLDHFQIWSWRLSSLPAPEQGGGPQPERRDVSHQYLQSIPLAQGMHREWYDLSPEPLPGRAQPNAVLIEAMDRAARSGIGWEIIHAFNANFIRGADCSEPNSFLRKFPGFIFVYDPPNGTDRPVYRFPRSTITPSGLATNQFGWRGPPLGLSKPPGTIRLAFVGASTTVNEHHFPFSYPELAAFWLNLWLQKQYPGVTLEVINAGREGISSTDIAAIVRDEVLPLEPDLVVYYEGANQFSAWSIIKPPPLWKVRRWLLKQLASVEPYSATARRLSSFIRLGPNVRSLSDRAAEPSKLDYRIEWPADIDENDPPLDHALLPLNLSTILHDLQDIRSHLRENGGELVLSSFFWLVYDGMRLDPIRDRHLYHHLNVYLVDRVYGPLRYTDRERFAAFQNQTYRKFAARNGLPFLDVAAMIPKDPELFVDAIHATYPGVRLHAWIVAQQLAPLLAQRLNEGRLPRPAQTHVTHHPAFLTRERTALIGCEQAEKATRVVVAPYASELKVPPP